MFLAEIDTYCGIDTYCVATHVQVVTGPFWARGNIAAKTTNGKNMYKSWMGESIHDEQYREPTIGNERTSTVVDGGIDPWWTLRQKRPLQMHEKVGTDPYRVTGVTDEQWREKDHWKCTYKALRDRIG